MVAVREKNVKTVDMAAFRPGVMVAGLLSWHSAGRGGRMATSPSPAWFT